MGSVCADTTLQGITVRGVHHCTTTSHGNQAMEKQGHRMNAEVCGYDEEGAENGVLQSNQSFPAQAKPYNSQFIPSGFTMLQ